MFHTTSPFRPHRASTPEFALEKPAPTPALKPGAGMGLADDTPIPTPDGWTTVGAMALEDAMLAVDPHSRRLIPVDALEMTITAA